MQKLRKVLVNHDARITTIANTVYLYNFPN